MKQNYLNRYIYKTFGNKKLLLKSTNTAPKSKHFFNTPEPGNKAIPIKFLKNKYNFSDCNSFAFSLVPV